MSGELRPVRDVWWHVSGGARAWLALRAAAVPPELGKRMERAMDDVVEGDTIPAALADAARGCLRDALAAGDDRAAALHLLAADALITYACEAAADEEGSALEALARAHAPEHLADLIEGSGAA